MADIDPLKVVRNPETLDAYRRYRREMRAAAQPWLAIACIAAPVGIGLALYAMFRMNPPLWSLAPSLALFVFGLSFAIAGFRIRRFRRARPFELP